MEETRTQGKQQSRIHRIEERRFSDCYYLTLQRAKYYERNKLDETAHLIAKKDVSSLQKLAVQLKKHIENVEPISSHLIRKLDVDVDELGTVLVPEETISC